MPELQRQHPIEGLESNNSLVMPIRVYLDSSDYSVLSDPERESREAPGVLEALKRSVQSGQIECFFSGAHLTEMAPTEARYTPAARRRADLLVDLCSKNCMVSHDVLFEREMLVALGVSSPPVIALDRDGGWFPAGVTVMSPVTALEHVQNVKETISELFPSRAERRRAERRVMKRGRPRAEVQAQILRQAREGSLREVLEVFPMRSDAARVLTRYVVGDATGEEATAAYESSLRDPGWMMQWFLNHHNQITPFIAWARGPAAELTEKVAALAMHLEEARNSPHLMEDERKLLLGREAWERRRTDAVAKLANQLVEKIRPGAGIDAATVDQRCPGISVAVRAVYTAWEAISADRPRKPKQSDFVDGLHAAYAPYVDVFRADAFMAPIISSLTDPFGTTVVPKLTQLPTAISRFESRSRRAVARPVG